MNQIDSSFHDPHALRHICFLYVLVCLGALLPFLSMSRSLEVVLLIKSIVVTKLLAL